MVRKVFLMICDGYKNYSSDNDHYVMRKILLFQQMDEPHKSHGINFGLFFSSLDAFEKNRERENF